MITSDILPRGQALFEEANTGHKEAIVTTVLGDVAPEELGHIAFHEHLLSDLRPRGSTHAPTAPAVDRGQITLPELYEIRRHDTNDSNLHLDSEEDALAELITFREFGGGTLVDLTPPCLGRDPEALRRLSAESGVHIVMGAGWYVHDFHGPELHALTINELAAEAVVDIAEGTNGIRAGVIGEIGLSWPSHMCERHALEAAAKASRQTGCALVVHPGRHPNAAFEALQLLVDSDADLTRTVISHIERTLFTLGEILALVEAGLTVAFDLFGNEASYYPHSDIDMPNDAGRVELIRALVNNGHTDRIVISQDICSKVRLRRWGGEGYAHILQRVLPLMRRRGLSEEAIHAITHTNPARLLARHRGLREERA